MSILLLAMLVMTPAPTRKPYCCASGKVFFDDSGSHYVTVSWYDGNNELLGYEEIYNSGDDYYIERLYPVGNDCALLAEPSWDTQSVEIELDIDFPEDYVEMPDGLRWIHYHDFGAPIPRPVSVPQ